MTLATVDDDDPSAVPTRGAHALVIGGSMAGLLAARVLSDGYDQVTIIKRDPMPDEAVAHPSGVSVGDITPRPPTRRRSSSVPRSPSAVQRWLR